MIATMLDGITDVEGLGLNLGIRMSALERIMYEYPHPRNQKATVIYHWLKRKDIVRQKQNVLPTWDVLATAVASLDPSLSDRIRDQHCRLSPTLGERIYHK